MAKKKSTREELTDSAHKVWLAGLGALATAGAEGEKLFHSLVKRGETLEEEIQRPVRKATRQVKSTVSRARNRAGETLDSLSSTFDETVTMALSRLGVPTRDEIKSLGRRVEKLTRAVEAKQGSGSKARKASSKKQAASKKKATAGKTARKSAPRKTTGRKVSRRKAKVTRRATA